MNTRSGVGHAGDRTSPAIDHRARELLSLGALVLLLGTAFVMLAIEPSRAALPPEVDRNAPSLASPVIDDRLVPAESTSRVTGATVPTPPAVAGMRVRLARLGIDLPLLVGDTHRDTVLQATPSGAAFLLPSSSPPGSGGNSYIYAHARRGMFLSLWDVRLGDVVEITTARGEARRYLVREIHPRVGPADIRHTLPTSDERITLQTSTGPRVTDPRFVVVASRHD